MATVASREHRFPYRWLAAIALILFVATLIACNQDGQNGDTQAEGIERLYNAEAVVPPPVLYTHRGALQCLLYLSSDLSL